MDTTRYQSPLISRYTSDEMQWRFSADVRLETWRQLWTELARAQKQLGVEGVKITDAQIAEMEQHQQLTVDEYAFAAEEEQKTRHDVTAHIRTYGRTCPLAAPIIHLGATSCYVTDNTDLILMRDGLGMIAVKLARAINRLRNFAWAWHALPTLAWTHFQPAQLTTVGKRACLWIQDLLMDLKEVEHVKNNLRFRGAKGTTGSQDSFLKLFNGNHEKVRKLDRLVTQSFGFNSSFTITGQTYSRKVDTKVLATLADIGSSVHGICTDLRLLQHLKEIEEPFEEEQVGSSAMPYKRNPMREERACSLGRHPIALLLEAYFTHATQWFERTLDDSAGRRIYIPEAFLAADAILKILQNVVEGLVVHERIIKRHIAEELPFMATEEIIVAMVKAGANRQECHERLRKLARTANANIKVLGRSNNLLKLIRADEYFAPVHSSIANIVEPARFIGRCPEQVDDFLKDEVDPALAPYADKLGETSQLHV